MSLYHISLDGDTMTVGFGDPAPNTDIVKEVHSTLATLIRDGGVTGGPLLKITGPASLPVGFVIAHAIGHLYGAIAVYDPKIPGYLVSISHHPQYAVGDIIAA